MPCVDAASLRQLLERIDAGLTSPTELMIRGGAAMLALGLQGRTTVDIDVLPSSRFVEAELRQACAAAGLAFNPPDKDFPPGDYIEIVPEQTLVLPTPTADVPYNTVFRGQRLTVALDEPTLREAFGRLPARNRRDTVLEDNLRYVVHDFLDQRR